MNDDPLDGLHSFDRIAVAAVLLPHGVDPGSALTAAGIVDPIAVEVRIGETLDLAQDFFGDGTTPNLSAVLETSQAGSEPDRPSQPPERPSEVSNSPQGSARSAATAPHRARSVAPNLPPAFGLRPVAPARQPGPMEPLPRGATVSSRKADQL